MHLTERQIKILKMILESKTYISSKNLSEKFEITSRSIRYDLANIRYFLSKNNFELEKKQGKGVYIQISEAEKIKFLYNLDSNIGVYQGKENFTFILAILLLLSKKSTIVSLAENLGISKNKVHRSLRDVEVLLENLNISLSKKPSVGIIVVGSEKEIRLAVYKINQLSDYKFYDYIIKCVDKDIYQAVYKIIECYQAIKQIRFSDISLKELVMLLCYQQIRVKQGYIISKQNINLPKDDISLIISLYKDENLDIFQEEAEFALKQILNTKLAYLPKTNDWEKHSHESYEITKNFANLATNRLGIDFAQNELFMKGLQLHLYSTLQRMSQGQDIANPLTEHIKYKYRFIFEITKNILSQIEIRRTLTFPEEEVAYIAIYLCSAFEMSSSKKFITSTLVVCNSGVGSSTLITARLQSMIPELKVMGFMDASEINKCDVSKVDFIISTIPLHIKDKEVVLVNPLLDIEDITKLKSMYLKYDNQKKIANIIPKEDRVQSYEMGDIISATRIQLQKNIVDWRKAIKQASLPMLKENFIEDIYVKEMIKATEELGSYMVFIPEVAVVHASPKMGVIKEGLSILTLTSPIPFGNKPDVSVSCIIVFSALAKKSELFIKIIYLLENSSNLEILLKSSEYENILKLEGSI